MDQELRVMSVPVLAAAPAVAHSPESCAIRCIAAKTGHGGGRGERLSTMSWAACTFGFPRLTGVCIILISEIHGEAFVLRVKNASCTPRVTLHFVFPSSILLCIRDGKNGRYG